MAFGRIPVALDERVCRQDLLHTNALDAHPTAVNQTNLAQTGLGGGPDKRIDN